MKHLNGVRKSWIKTSQELVKKHIVQGDGSSELIGGLSKEDNEISDSDISENESI